jgi:hypothetical protein
MEANQPLNSYDVPEGVIEKLEKKEYTRRIDLPRTDDMSPWMDIKEECELSGPEINMLIWYFPFRHYCFEGSRQTKQADPNFDRDGLIGCKDLPSCYSDEFTDCKDAPTCSCAIW